MGHMNITWELVLAFGTVAGAVVSFIWHVAMYVGKLSVKLERHEDRLNDHDDELKFLKSLR
jgi:hypothetical protein